MQKQTAHRMMEKLSGRELFTAVMKGHVERMGNQPCSFNDEDYDRALNALDKKPQEYREYYRWCRANDVITFLSGEIRVMAMEGCWKLGILAMQIISVIRQPDGEPPKERQPEHLRKIAAKICSEVQQIGVQALALKTFEDVIGVNLLALVRREVFFLEQNVAVYERLASAYDDHLTLQQRKESPIQGFLPSMPALLTEASPDLQRELADCIRTYRGDNFMEVLQTLYERLQQGDVPQHSETEDVPV